MLLRELETSWNFLRIFVGVVTVYKVTAQFYMMPGRNRMVSECNIYGMEMFCHILGHGNGFFGISPVKLRGRCGCVLMSTGWQ